MTWEGTDPLEEAEGQTESAAHFMDKGKHDLAERRLMLARNWGLIAIARELREMNGPSGRP